MKIDDNSEPCPEEFIICSAVHYALDFSTRHIHINGQPKNIKKGYVICGHRHHNCLQTHHGVAKTLLKEVNPPSGSKQGFLTSKNRFVDRKEALDIATRADQLNDEPIRGGKLYSENIY